MTVSARIKLLLFIAAAGLALLATITFTTFYRLDTNIRGLADDTLQSTHAILRIQALTAQSQAVSSRRIYWTNGHEEQDSQRAALDTESKRLFQHYSDNLLTDNQDKALLDASAQLFEQWRAVMDKSIGAALEQRLDDAILIEDQEAKPLANQLSASLDKWTSYNDKSGELSRQSAFDAMSSARYVVGITSGVTIVIVLLLGIWLHRSILIPIRGLLKVNERIASGDLRSVIEVKGNDEFSSLMRSTQGMQDNLRDTIKLIGESSTQLASATEEMNAVTEESSRGLQRQNNEIDQAATAVNQMTAAVDEVARNASSASEAARVSDQSARTGAQQVSSTVSAIEKLGQTVQSTSTDVERLAVQSKDISKVLEVIRTIAEQTNLLALNAAIEAARAGEQGRGFAVVADEVRALAHRTQTSTQEVERMIDGILKGAEQATKAMSESCTQVEGTLSIAHEAGAALTLIAKSINDINEMNMMIATASEQQAQVARSVDGNLMSIRDLSIQSAEGANQTAAASSELSRLALDMSKLVARFSL